MPLTKAIFIKQNCYLTKITIQGHSQQATRKIYPTEMFIYDNDNMMAPVPAGKGPKQ